MLRSIISKQGLQKPGLCQKDQANFQKLNKLVLDSTYKSTNKNAFSPLMQRSKELVFLRKGLNSPDRKEAHKLLMAIQPEGLYSPPRFPKAKPFFNQAYLAKSEIEKASQTSRKPKGSVQKFLPEISKKYRFNEEIKDSQSVASKGSKFSRAKLRLSNLKNSDQLQTLQHHYQQLSERKLENRNEARHTEALKDTLIKSIDMMNEKEMKVMKNAFNTVSEVANGGKLSKTNLKQLTEIEDGVQSSTSEEEQEGELDEQGMSQMIY